MVLYVKAIDIHLVIWQYTCTLIVTPSSHDQQQGLYIEACAQDRTSRQGTCAKSASHGGIIVKGAEKVRATIGLGEATVLEEAHASQSRYECVKIGGTSVRSDCREQWHFKTCTGQTHVIGCKCTEDTSQQEINARRNALRVTGHSQQAL